MNTKTRKALQESIAHWERHATGKSRPEEGVHSEDCALCDLFLDNDNCQGCPVQKKTHSPLCQNTPWRAASDAFDHGLGSKQFRAAARRMLVFLRGLEEKPK